MSEHSSKLYDDTTICRHDVFALKKTSFTIYPEFRPLFLTALSIIVPLFVVAFILYFYIVEGIYLTDMLQSWQIFLSPSLLPSCLVIAVLVAFIVAFMLRKTLTVTLQADGLLLHSKQKELLSWQAIQSLQRERFLLLECICVRLNNQRCYYLAPELWQLELADATGKLKRQDLEAIIDKALTDAAAFNKDF